MPPSSVEKWTRTRSADIVAVAIDSIFDSNMRHTHNALTYKTSIFAVPNAPKHKNNNNRRRRAKKKFFLCLKFYKRVINIECVELWVIGPKTALKEWCVTRCRSIMLRFDALHRVTRRVSDSMIESWIRHSRTSHLIQQKLYIEKWTHFQLE